MLNEKFENKELVTKLAKYYGLGYKKSDTKKQQNTNKNVDEDDNLALTVLDAMYSGPQARFSITPVTSLIMEEASFR